MSEHLPDPNNDQWSKYFKKNEKEIMILNREDVGGSPVTNRKAGEIQPKSNWLRNCLIWGTLGGVGAGIIIQVLRNTP